jgi:hypothetical protein
MAETKYRGKTKNTGIRYPVFLDLHVMQPALFIPSVCLYQQKPLSQNRSRKRMIKNKIAQLSPRIPPHLSDMIVGLLSTRELT